MPNYLSLSYTPFTQQEKIDLQIGRTFENCLQLDSTRVVFPITANQSRL